MLALVWPASNEPSRQRHDTQDRRDEEKLTNFNANIEEQQRHWNRRLRQADCVQGTCKTESMQQAKSESDNPRPALGPTLPPFARMNNLARPQKRYSKRYRPRPVVVERAQTQASRPRG